MSQNTILTDQLIQKMRSLPEADQRMLLVLVERLAAAPGTTSTNGAPSSASVGTLQPQPPIPDPPVQKEGRKSAMGMLAHLGIHITTEDIAEARREMWGNFPRDFPDPTKAP